MAWLCSWSVNGVQAHPGHGVDGGQTAVHYLTSPLHWTVPLAILSAIVVLAAVRLFEASTAGHRQS